MSEPRPSVEIEPLFERYRRDGDLQALGRVYDAAAPQLQALARRLAPSRADADDLLQATFLTAIERAESFDGTRKLLPWLLGILAHHALSARRRRGRAPDTERLLVRESDDPADVAERTEISSVALGALADLPQRYREVLEPVLIDDERAVDVAQRKGASAGVVRMQVHRGLELLRRALPAGAALGGALWFGRSHALARIRVRVLEHAREHGPAAGAGAPHAVARPSTGLVARWVGIGAVVGLCGWLWLARDDAPREPRSAPPLVAQPSSAAAPSSGALVAAVSAPSVVPTSTVAIDEPAGAPSPATGASLDVRVHWSDGTPAERVEIVVWRLDEPDPARSALHASTSSRGRARFDDCAGRLSLRVDRAGTVGIEVLPGEQRKLDIDLPGGLDVAVHVIDARGESVAGASIGLSTLHHQLFGAEIARTDANGLARVRDLPAGRKLVAWKAGHACSMPHLVAMGSVAAQRADATLVLRAGGATLRGRVLDADGHPAVGAEVRSGPDPTLRERDASQEIALLTRTGPEGNYVLHGVPSGQVELRVRHGDAAPFHAQLTLAAGEDRAFDARLARGARIHGTLRAQAGDRSAGDDDEVWLTIGEPGTFSCVQRVARIGAEFEISGLVAGRHDLYATSKVGLAHVRGIELALGATVEQDVLLEPPARIAGRVVERGSGRPLAGWHVVAHKSGSGRIGYARTDEQGAFSLGGLAVERADLRIHAPTMRTGEPQVVLRDISAGALDLYIETVDPSAR